MLAPEVAAVAFALGVGQTTSYPVYSEGRYYIIQVEARRRTEPPPFEPVCYILEQNILKVGVDDLKKKALKGVPITFYGFAGKQPAKAK